MLERCFCHTGVLLQKATVNDELKQMSKTLIFKGVDRFGRHPTAGCDELLGHAWRRLFAGSVFAKRLHTNRKGDAPGEVGEVFVQHFQR